MNKERVSKSGVLNARPPCGVRRLLQLLSVVCLLLIHSLDGRCAEQCCLPGTVLSPADTERVALRFVPKEPAVRWRHQAGAEMMMMQ